MARDLNRSIHGRAKALLAAGLLGWVLGFSAGSAQAASSPQRIGFQGKLLDASNNPRNGPFDMVFKLYTVPSGGASVWDETQSNVQVTNGVFSVELGSVKALETTLFTSASAYLEIKVGTDSPMTPRQLLLMSPSAFRALYAEDLAPGDTNYIQQGSALQSGAVFHVTSATVAGPFTASGISSFTATGAQTYSLTTSSGLKVLDGTLKVEGSAGAVVDATVRASTLTATDGIILPQGSAFKDEGTMRWEPTQNLLYIGTGTANKTMVDTDSSQTLTNKTLNSTGGNTVDATHLRARLLSSDAPSQGMTIKWNAGASQWYPVYPATVSVVSVQFTPSASLTLTANNVYFVPVVVPGVMALNQFRYRVANAAAGVTGDVGLYDSSGNRIASGGAGSADFITTGAKAVLMQGAPVTVQPGQYYFAMVANGGARPRGVDLGAASAGVVKGLGAVDIGAATLPATVNVGAIVDGSLCPLMSINE
ncbi:MAG: hypothetical protein HY924_15300 [Elusimicrobia bacterium]|nr:hypothetical protein [Elusimicrobiota bacterium]